FDISEILNLFPNIAIIKFNTALLFSLSSISILIFSKQSKIYSLVYITASVIILIISFLTLYQYYFESEYEIDNFFIQDEYSSGYPGRMSETTAFCFLLTGFSLLGMHSKNVLFRRSVQYLLIIIAIL